MDIHQALIIGGSGGIGEAVARQLFARNVDVTLAARNARKLHEAVDTLSGSVTIQRRPCCCSR
jgi:short-subunit dehydrogenase